MYSLSLFHIWQLPKGTKILLKNSSEYIDVSKISQSINENLIEKIKSRQGRPIVVKFPINFETENWASFIGAILSEGSISKRNGIGFWNKNSKFFKSYDFQPKLLMNTLELLNKMGIRTSQPFQEIKRTKNGEISYNWKLFIKGKKNFQIFKEKINFQIKNQQLLLEEAINSFVRPKLSDNESLFLVIQAIQNASSEKSFATKHDIAKLTNLKLNWIERLLKRAVNENKAKVIGGGNRKERGYGKYPYHYMAI